MFNLIGLGEILWDLLPAGRQLGGAPANFAYHANALGSRGRIVSRVGSDQNGTDILARLNQLGLNVDLIQIDPEAPTGTVSVEVSRDGQPRYVIHQNVAWDRIAATDEARAAIAEADAICFGTLAQRSEISRGAIHALLRAAKGNALRILDINLRQQFYSAEVIEQSLRAANILKLNDHELPVLSKILSLRGDVREQLTELTRRFDLRLVAYTQGGKGSVLLSDAQCSEHPGLPARVADTIGAGDSFTAALSLGLLRGWDLGTINENANRIGSFVASQPGATPKVPTELRELFSKAPCA
jgi:fructokinase